MCIGVCIAVFKNRALCLTHKRRLTQMRGDLSLFYEMRILYALDDGRIVRILFTTMHQYNKDDDDDDDTSSDKYNSI